jgi:hypothetical protein
MNSSLENWIAHAGARDVDTTRRFEIDGEPWIEAAASYRRRHFVRILVGEIDGVLSLRIETGLGGSVASQGLVLGLLPTPPDGESWRLIEQEGIVTGQLDFVSEAWATDLALQCDHLLAQLSGENQVDSLASKDPPLGTSPLPLGDAARFPGFAFGLRIDQSDQIHCELIFGGRLEETHLATLHRTVERNLTAKFDLASVDSKVPFRPSALDPMSVRCAFLFRANPIDSESSPLEDILSTLQIYLEELKTLDRAGVNLFAFFGVTAGQECPELRKSATGQGDREVDGDFELSFPEAGAEYESADAISLDDPKDGLLRQGHFADARLRVDDCEDALVDVVLRHPGCSNRRIGQVLSILFSISYLDASELAERAPCVIGWRVGQQAARKIKDVVEPTGAKIVLVPTDSFAPG